MRIDLLPSGLLPIPGFQHPAPAASADPRSRGERDGARPPVARVFEGELVARPVDREPPSRPAPDPTPVAPRVPLAAGPAASGRILFYLLHSSEEALAAGRPGRHFDRYA